LRVLALSNAPGMALVLGSLGDTCVTRKHSPLGLMDKASDF
jgi:hypothetical protein